MPTPFDVAFARGHFPALSAREPEAGAPPGRAWALMDNAGGSVTPTSVIRRVGDYMSRYQVQLGASYPRSVAAQALVDAGHRAAEALVGAAPGEVVIGPSTTVNARVLARALLPLLAPGDEVVITDLDHEANRGPWRALADHGIHVREWRVDPASALLRAEDLAPLLGPRTRLVCFTHCANVVGALHDVAAITRLAHAAGAWVCVDGVAFAPHRLVDVAAWDVDFYLVSLYKVFGPHLGLLYGKRDLLLQARGQSHDFVGEDEVPYKLQPGGVPHELAAALPGILEYLDALHDRHDPGAGGDARTRLARTFARIAAHEAALAAPLVDWLAARPGIRLLGPPSADPGVRAPTIAFAVAGRHASEIPPRLEAHRIAIRWGHFYAPRAVEALGLAAQGGVVRISLAHYNTADEVARLIEALDGVV